MKRTGTVAAVLALLLAAPAIPAAGEADPAAGGKIDEIVVTATRLETPESEIGSSVTVITSEQIGERGATTVAEALRGVPALDVVRAGGAGKTTSVFLRGAKSEHTLVLLDGVEMNDPSSTGRGFDFGNLTAGNIERIEIVRGPQSVLYGSDAMGGVVNIITKKGTGKPSGFLSAEGGYARTLVGQAGVAGSAGPVNYSLGVSRLVTDGISAAAEKDGNREEDGYRNTTVSTRLGIAPAKDFDADLILRYIDADADIDNAGGSGGDDPNNTLDTRQLFLRIQSRLSLFDDLWEQRLGFSLSDQSQDYGNGIDADHPSDLERGGYDGRIVKVDWQHDLRLHESNTLTLGVETEKESASSTYYSESLYGPYSSDFPEKAARTTGYFLQDRIRLGDAWVTTLGARIDDHSRFGTKTTWRAATSFLFRQTSTRIKGSVGTGFKAPSLYQLYSVYGDENLDPEKSTGWDAGVEQTFLRKRLTIGAAYFSNDFENLIDFDSASSQYVNVGKAETKGVELSLSVRATDDLTLRASHTLTDTEDKATGKELLRRPKNKSSADVDYRFAGRGNVNLSLLVVGGRDDSDYSSWPAARVRLGGYALVNLAASYDIADNVRISGRVDNLFDKDYEEVCGYGTYGISAYAGMRYSF
jgi:vitamin B12 transporter